MQCLFCDHELEHTDPPELFVEIIEHVEEEHPDRADVVRDMWGMELDEAKESIGTNEDRDEPR